MHFISPSPVNQSKREFCHLLEQKPVTRKRQNSFIIPTNTSYLTISLAKQELLFWVYVALIWWGRCHLLFICRVWRILEDLKEVKALPAEPLLPVEEKKTNESCRIKHPACQQGFPPQPGKSQGRGEKRIDQGWGQIPAAHIVHLEQAGQREKRTESAKREITCH